MRDFHCSCGQRVFFYNSECLNCGRSLGFDTATGDMKALRPAPESGVLRTDDGERYRYCRNHTDYRACNWLLPADSDQDYCESCRLNQTIPDLTQPGNTTAWAKLEAGKRHLIYTLLQLGLPLYGKDQDLHTGLAFAFLEDSRTDPQRLGEEVMTGHGGGLITVNLAEADDGYREQIRRELGEYYRTILGHFRHESGHYYYERLVRDTPWMAEFESLFGDPGRDYEAALRNHYEQGPSGNWPDSFISAYAQSHPLEDWAETWAHYLHMLDTLETAYAFGAAPSAPQALSIGQLVDAWRQLSMTLNALNRSMGLADAYPFVITDRVAAKLHLIHQVVVAARQ